VTNPTAILLIDDDQVDRATVRRALAKSGLAHELVEAADGRSGLELARGRHFDCVLLDYRLPDIDSAELLAALLSPEGGKQAVLMLTGVSDQEIALRLIQAGALDYLTKNEMTPPSLARAIRYAKARRAVLAELEAKSRALDELNQQKSLLFSIIAHDLRNPFQVILAASQALGQATDSRDHAYIERRAQGLHLAASQAYGLMESLFAWARLQMDSVAVELTETDLASLAEETVDTMRQIAADKAIRLATDCAGLRVRAQRDMLGTVLRNLLSNAVKFTRPDGAVVIRAVPDGETVEIRVEDTGIGMPPERVETLFRLDRRASSTGTAGERGSGFGLLLCRDLVERLGGRLEVSSTVGVGTVFSFRLPGV
jgi:signal transduction histidine kinase